MVAELIDVVNRRACWKQAITPSFDLDLEHLLQTAFQYIEYRSRGRSN